MCSSIQIFATATGQLLRTLNSQSDFQEEINVVSALATHPNTSFHFISGARDGKISLWDVRCPQTLQWRFLAHTGKLSSLNYSESGCRLLSSGRDSSIRLWDYRKLPASETLLSDYVQQYTGHVTFGHWVPASFLNHDQYVLTGSEVNKVFIYDTHTGQLEKTITLGTSKVIFTIPVPDSIAFYYVNLSTQTLGLCDVSGEPVRPQDQTPVQIHQQFLREKMHEVMLDYSDVIIGELSRLGVLERTGLHQIIGTLSQSQDQRSREVVGLIMRKYEERVTSSQHELSDRIMSSTTLPSCIFPSAPEPVKQKSRPRASLAPKVTRERCSVQSPTLVGGLSDPAPSSPLSAPMKLDRDVCMCQYCNLDVEMGEEL